MSKLFIVGIGPGGAEHLTSAARTALEAAGVVVGYRPYLDLIAPLLAGKETIASGMRQEVERCRTALARAAAGATVALVSSGDAGIYGMAGLALELVENDRCVCSGFAGEPIGSPQPDLDIEIVPGVSALQAAAARLGAPLMHDFAVISLSDLLTSWEAIRRRLEAAAAADFVTVLYNPRSRGRRQQIGEALSILGRRRSPQTPVGIVRNAGRPGEVVTVTTLDAVPEEKIDMLSLVIVGSSATFLDGAGRMVTPRGYAVRSEEPGVRSEELSPLTPHSSPLTDKKGAALFVGGTGSDVGKSVITAGLCRILKRRGFSVAPFKAQNMALNSAVTPQGGEIGRAQAVQAAACGLPPHVDMNPVLLKPNSDTGSQVIVQGRPVGNMTASQYHLYKPELFTRVRQAFERLAEAHDVVIMEGAGSIAEINLKAHDITNLRAAGMAGAPVLLVADIDRGGVFASIVGTFELLEPAERAMLAGVIINKFRGDPSLLAPGIAAIEARTGVPVLGVIPWLDLRLPGEDSVALARKGPGRPGASVRIGVVRLPRLSNYTDFDPLEGEPGVSLAYLDDPAGIAGLDLLILPGTKSTIADLEFLRAGGWLPAIRRYHAAGGRVAGICGGFQMLGRRIRDPLGSESDREEAEGIGLVDSETVLQQVKQTHQAAGVFLPAAGDAGLPAGGTAAGYEIHLGETTLGPLARPLLRLTQRSGCPEALEDGAVSPDGRVWGTYLHGLFDNEAVRRALLATLCPAGERREQGAVSGLEAELDRLADHLEAHLDLTSLLRHLQVPRRTAV